MVGRGSRSSARGDATREALITAAIEAFGQHGFDAVSTRAIAEAAGVNQALIAYHFRGKPGLYLAALQSIADAVQQRMGPMVGVAEDKLGAMDGGSSATPKELLEVLFRLLDAFVAMLVADEFSARARLILREQQAPSAGFDVLYDGIMSRVLDVTERLIGRICGSDHTAVGTRLMAFTVLGQALIFRAARAAVMRHMQWRTVGEDELASIRAQIRRNVAVILGEELQA